VSETASTIIKLLSALTSPKACIRYIAVAVFIVLSWQYLNELLIELGLPEEQLSIVVLLIGVGIGSLIGQTLTFLGTKIWDSIYKAIQTKKTDKAKVLALAEKQAQEEANNRRLIQRYENSLSHLNWDQKEKLRELTLRER